jgi:hypothetical protein
MKTYGGVEVYLHNYWPRYYVEVVSFMPRPRWPRRKKPPQVPIEQEAEWAPEPVCTLWRREKSLAPDGTWTPTAKPVGISTELYLDWATTISYQILSTYVILPLDII